MSRVSVCGGKFLIDGNEFQIISGTMHYFRIPHEYWRDRLEKAVAMGLNTIESYMCWNLHEPRPGEYDFTGDIDFEKFIRTAQELGLYVIVRPGPYICSEWDNGGIPVWLLKNPGLRVRRSNKIYLDAVKRYFDVILPKLRALELDNGGPVIAMQIENEYGSYGHDTQYLKTLRDMFLASNCTSPLFTMDGNGKWYIDGGSVPGVWQTMSFGSRGVESFKEFHNPDNPGPDGCMEFWNGWFDHWGEKHHTRDVKSAADELDAMLKYGAAVNMYAFAGGTNFGFRNGANCVPYAEYQPTTTSYDFDAPVSECGDITGKFLAFREVIRKYRSGVPEIIPENPRKKAYGAAVFSGSADLLVQLDNLGEQYECLDPEPMEYFDQAFGFIHYRTKISTPGVADLRFYDLHDRAQIFLDNRYIGTIYRNDEKMILEGVQIPPGGAMLDVLVENMGRINYGPWLAKDFKGLTGGMMLNLQLQTNWLIHPLPMDDLSRLDFGEFAFTLNRPAFHFAEFEVDEPADTFVCFPGVKGVMWVNGHNLGRYWENGPAKTLYLPGCWLKKGKNQLIVLELHQLYSNRVEFKDQPLLSGE